MAEAIAKSISGADWDIWSAGSHPSGSLNPVAVELVRELGLELSSHRSKGLGEVPHRRSDYVVTMGCGDNCPIVQTRQRLAWEIPDPVGLPIEEARRIRDHIGALVRELIGQSTGRGGLDKSSGSGRR